MGMICAYIVSEWKKDAEYKIVFMRQQSRKRSRTAQLKLPSAEKIPLNIDMESVTDTNQKYAAAHSGPRSGWKRTETG